MDGISLRPRGIGELLDGALRLYRQDIGLYALTAILGYLPMAVGTVLVMGAPDAAGMASVIVFVGAVLYLVVWGALTIEMNDRLHGRSPELVPSLGAAAKLFVRFIWGGFLAYIVLVGVLMVTGLAAMVAGGVTSALAGQVVGAIVAVIAGAAVVFTIGVRALAAPSLFLPAIVGEGLTGYASIKRGWALTKKGAYRVLAVVVVASLLVSLPTIAVYFVTGTFETFTDPTAVMTGTVSMGQLAIQQLLIIVASGFTTPFMVGCLLLTYYDQRVRVEAFDLETEAGSLAA